MRLDKYICRCTELSRSEAKKLLKQGLIKVNGEIEKDPGAQVYEESDVRLDGRQLSFAKARYIMLHKPMDCICSNVDELYPSVLHLLEIDRAFDLHIAGRLDADTTGLVLVTDDGQWSHRITSPKKSCAKRYRVQTSKPIPESAIESFKDGVQLQNEKNLTKPAILEILAEKEALLTITEGKYHQVKRMFAAIGNRVVGLHREQIGEIELDPDMSLGEWRYLTEKEIASV
ncbi:16S rRNA pseudouridine(516) synthase RsuA [Thalassotalea sp. HSM 43]|uniref:16S rRNA pseudouridine(516) synthase RsuA n=1 Tax=Thalassotalea sp. HSM 43 TaxID=2552945 RepID=UPI00108035EC|nr:16S rRNA pseudouridine(516) synthase RsuA [Thalassotalea sp. HSM 43]QBY03172.1 16S rRNA pseudouridine(516) synthase RsuA [Thalassotalea sp. HSM 43]